MSLDRCDGNDTICQRVHILEPRLPLRVPLDVSSASGKRNARPLHANKCQPGDTSCSLVGRVFPLVHLFGAYHSFMEEALGSGLNGHGVQDNGFLSGRTDVRMEKRCLNAAPDVADSKYRAERIDSGGSTFMTHWRTKIDPSGNPKLLIAECMTDLMWYPNLAGRYANEWGKAYWPCKNESIRVHGRPAFVKQLMWNKCRPEALAMHDVAHGTDGPGGTEVTPPFVLRMLYPAAASPKVVIMLRNPTERFETSFWLHPHYRRRYGATGDGLHAYATHVIEAFRTCEASFSVRRCAFLFENLSKDLGRTFFMCDQLIRGLYWPFVAEWRAAFGESNLMVLKAEDFLDASAEHRTRLLDFLGLPPPPPAGSEVAAPPSYAAMHAASLRSYGAVPMHDATRDALDGFYLIHNARLALLLGWRVDTWRSSSPLPNESFAQGASIVYRRYGPYPPTAQKTDYNASPNATHAIWSPLIGGERRGNGRRRHKGAAEVV